MKTHIQLPHSERYTRVIVCGSPERAEWMASQLESPELIARNREYHSYLGQFRDTDILITSHGVGAAGAAICFQELVSAGAKMIVRIGTAGGLRADAQIGDIIVATAAIRNDGVSSLMIPTSYPAVANLELTSSMARVIKRNTPRQRTGIILTSDLFYPGKLPSELPLFRDCGVLAVEMECSPLFVIAQLNDVKAAAAVVVDGTPLQAGDDNYDPRLERLKPSIQLCFEAALETLAGIEEQGN